MFGCGLVWLISVFRLFIVVWPSGPGLLGSLGQWNLECVKGWPEALLAGFSASLSPWSGSQGQSLDTLWKPLPGMIFFDVYIYSIFYVSNRRKYDIYIYK